MILHQVEGSGMGLRVEPPNRKPYINPNPKPHFFDRSVSGTIGFGFRRVFIRVSCVLVGRYPVDLVLPYLEEHG